MSNLVKKEPIWTKSFVSLFFTNISVFIVFYGLVTTLPLYAIGVLNRTDEEAGLLMTVFLLSAIVVRPFTGKILDIAGKRKMLWIGLVLYLICTVLYYFIQPFAGLLVLRFVQGIWFSIITTATISIAADIVPITAKGSGSRLFFDVDKFSRCSRAINSAVHHSILFIRCIVYRAEYFNDCWCVNIAIGASRGCSRKK